MAIAHPSRVARAQERPTDPQPKTKLSVKDQKDAKELTQRRRARSLKLGAALIVTGALLIVVIGQAMVASQQVRMDNLHAQLTSAVNANENMQLTKAQLEAPGRILILAQHSLHMIVPKSVTYLNPVVPGETVQAARSGQRG